MAKNWLQQMLGRMFQPVSQHDALRIASQSLLNDAMSIHLICHGTKSAQFSIYASPPERCWCVQVPWSDGNDGLMIRSSRVIVIGRQTGIIH